MLYKVLSRAFRLRLGSPTRVYRVPQQRRPCSNNTKNSDEVSRARAAAANAPGPTVFDKIISRELPADILYEDELCIAFSDVTPQAPIHMLVVPKQRLPTLQDARDMDQQLLGHLLLVASRLGAARAPAGWRLVVNNGADGAQSVYQLHLHVLGGRQMGWPPG